MVPRTWFPAGREVFWKKVPLPLRLPLEIRNHDGSHLVKRGVNPLGFLAFQNHFEILKFLGFQNYFEILIFCFSRKIKIILKFWNFQNFSKIILKFWPKQNFGKIILKFCYFKISKYFWNFQFHTAFAPWSTIGSSKQPWITYGEHLFFKP